MAHSIESDRREEKDHEQDENHRAVDAHQHEAQDSETKRRSNLMIDEGAPDYDAHSHTDAQEK